ncbi:MAG: hypothetical protein JSW23_01765 [Planctomycetota bacterium]|nr:MAG: hypothetical protein JSW23_01765 [Planctomycetota bacterium]
MDRFKKALERQIKFMETSCRLFDEGDRDEAIRIATCIRVLVHDTGASISILKHLNAKDIKVFTTRPVFADGEKEITFWSMGQMTFGGGEKEEYGPILGDLSDCEVLPVAEWWGQVIWALDPDCELTREDLVKAAANKEGGAHVDVEACPKYKRLEKTDFGKCGGQPVADMHLVSLRTMANELIQSPELLKLME